MALPTFHTMGIFLQLLTPLMSGQAVALYAPHAPAPPPVPNPDSILEISRLTGCSGLPAVPSFLEASTLGYVSDSLKLMFSFCTVLGSIPFRSRISGKLEASGQFLSSIFLCINLIVSYTRHSLAVPSLPRTETSWRAQVSSFYRYLVLPKQVQPPTDTTQIPW